MIVTYASKDLRPKNLIVGSFDPDPENERVLLKQPLIVEVCAVLCDKYLVLRTLMANLRGDTLRKLKEILATCGCCCLPIPIES